jgi:hypothetical protein
MIAASATSQNWKKTKPWVVGIFVMAIYKLTHANNTFNEVHEFGIHMGI